MRSLFFLEAPVFLTLIKTRVPIFSVYPWLSRYVSLWHIRSTPCSTVLRKLILTTTILYNNQSKLAWEDPRSNRGYVQVGRERVTQSTDAAEIAALRAKAPDSKETMEIGRDWDTTWKNMWPHESDAPGFKQTMLHFFKVLSVYFYCLTLLFVKLTRLADMSRASHGSHAINSPWSRSR